MSADLLDSFSEIWLADFEFHAPAGERPEPLCVVAREFRSGQTVRHWLERRGDNPPGDVPPFVLGPEALLVAFYASAELGCFLALDWPLPARVLDLFAEFRCRTNGLAVPCGSGLLGALAYFGLDSMAAIEKAEMRDLAMRGGPYTPAEQEGLLEYCAGDVHALDRLLRVMLPEIDLPRAMLRGRYMAAAARMEWMGIPIDTRTLTELRYSWERIKSQLIDKIDVDFGVYVPTHQRTINPDSLLGRGLLDTAEHWGIDPHLLADAVDEVWEEQRTATAEIQAALTAARKVTGLDARRIGRWEDEGKDSATSPGLDTSARELAGQFPALGIGRGFDLGTGYDATDYAGELWDRLRKPPPKPQPRHHPEILERAAQRIEAAGETAPGKGVPKSFSAARFSEWLDRNGIPWPRLESGALDLTDDTFRDMAKRYPAVAPLRELRHSLSQLRLNDLAVGSDGRNRCLLSAFRAKTGRNQPSNSAFAFGPSCWLRALIQPGPGRAVAYIDWAAQEIAIAAALSGDAAMQAAYSGGDPYLWLAQAGRYAPPEATKRTHPEIRDIFKVVYLAANYGMQASSLAQLIGRSPAHAQELLRLHQECFPVFWRWSDGAVAHAMLLNKLWTVFGWTVKVGSDTKPTSLRNFPVQANGAEMLRLACCLATERGIAVCAPVHDALLIEADASEIDQAVADCQAAMKEASEIVLDGFALRTDAKIIRHPDRYLDPRGVRMWETVCRLLPPLEEPF